MTEPLAGDDDRKFHRGEPDPFWNESSFFSLSAPERHLHGFIYFWFRPNMNFACGGPALWDPSGSRTWDCLYYDWDWPQEIPAGAEALDFRLDNGLAVETVTPLEEYRLAYESEQCVLDLAWRAVTPHHETVIGAGLEQTGRRHYEQFGRMTGTAIVSGERVDIDCYSIRDRSWGPRRMQVSPKGDYCWALASPDLGFHAVAVGAPEDDVDQIMAGMLIRDGKIGDLVDGQRWVVERDGPRPVRVRVEATDSLGRTLSAEGRIVNHLEWQGYGHQFEWWSLAEWEFDGQRCWGEDQEFHPLRHMRRHVRRFAPSR